MPPTHVERVWAGGPGGRPHRDGTSRPPAASPPQACQREPPPPDAPAGPVYVNALADGWSHRPFLREGAFSRRRPCRGPWPGNPSSTWNPRNRRSAGRLGLRGWRGKWALRTATSMRTAPREAGQNFGADVGLRGTARTRMPAQRVRRYGPYREGCRHNPSPWPPGRIPRRRRALTGNPHQL